MIMTWLSCFSACDPVDALLYARRNLQQKKACLTGQNNRILHCFEFEDAAMHGLIIWQHFHKETALSFQAAIFWTMIRSASSSGWHVAPGSVRPFPSRQQAAFRLCPGMFQEHPTPLSPASAVLNARDQRHEKETLHTDSQTFVLSRIVSIALQALNVISDTRTTCLTSWVRNIDLLQADIQNGSDIEWK